MLFALADFTARASSRILPALHVVEIYGRVPFFYYILHFYILHLLSLVMVMFARAYGTRAPAHTDLQSRRLPGASFGLSGVYLIWACVVAALYLPCRWFAGLKARRRDWWLSYL